jgi:hypothetical protein
MVEAVGEEMLLFKCHPGRENEAVLSMDLPFIIFIPPTPGGQKRLIPPASLQLPSRIAETSYELVVSLQQGHSDVRKYAFPVPLTRYDTLSTFGMYNRPESNFKESDHLITLHITLPRWSYGPLDPVNVYIKLVPNLDWLSKARKVTIQKVTVYIDEEIVFNPEGDEPTRKTRQIAKQSQAVGIKMPEAGYMTNLGVVFPAKDPRDAEGIVPRPKAAFPLYAVAGFTTTGSLYKIEYYLTVKATLSGAKDVVLRQPIVVCPYDHAQCKMEMEAIELAAQAEEPVLEDAVIVRASEANGLRTLGIAMVGGTRRPVID